MRERGNQSMLYTKRKGNRRNRPEGKKVRNVSLDLTAQALGQEIRINLFEMKERKTAFRLSHSPSGDSPNCSTPPLLPHVGLAHRSTQNQAQPQRMRETRKDESEQSTLCRLEHALYTCTKNEAPRGLPGDQGDGQTRERNSKHACANPGSDGIAAGSILPSLPSSRHYEK